MLSALTSGRRHQQNGHINNQPDDPVAEIKQRRVDTMARGGWVGILPPVVVDGPTPTEPCDGDLGPMGDGEPQDNRPDDAGAEDAAVEEKDRELGCRDAGDVDDHEGVGCLVQLGELLVRDHPEVLAAAPLHADQAADGGSDAHCLVFVSFHPLRVPRVSRFVLVFFCPRSLAPTAAKRMK